MLVDRLKAGTRYTAQASYNPANHYVPNSVKGTILLTKKEWHKYGGETFFEDEKLLDEDNRLHGRQ
jgi:hypothetical protein